MCLGTASDGCLSIKKVMASTLDQLLQLEVPIIVRLGERAMPMGEILALVPGMILELPKPADEELELQVNNKVIGAGTAVKVGENFGIKISFIGDMTDRIKAMGPATGHSNDEDDDDESVAAMAAKLLGGQ